MGKVSNAQVTDSTPTLDLTFGPGEGALPGKVALPAAARERFTLVIPAYNEEVGLAAALAEVKEELGESLAEVIVVDDGSTDRTAEIAEAAGTRVIRHPSNRGYGAALKTGIRAAETAYVITMDADGQHRAEDVVRLCKTALDEPQHDLVVGQRTQRRHSPLWRLPGKWFLTELAEYLTKQEIPDLSCGLRVMRREVALKYLSLASQGFSFSTTMTLALMCRGYSVKYVPVKVRPRVGTRRVRIHTGFESIVLVFRLAALFNPLRVFLPASILSIVFGVGWAIPDLAEREGVTVLSMLAILTGILLLALGLICDQVSQLRLERHE